MAIAGSTRVFARGTLVLWTSKPWTDQNARSGDGDAAAILEKTGISTVLDPSIHRVAMANPAHAPYGRAAEAALRNAGLLEKVRGKLVTAENVAQTAQFVESGNADAGFVALTAVISARNAGLWTKIPQNLYPPLDQAAVVTVAGQNRAGVREFMDFLGSSPAKAVLQRYGFADPSAASSPQKSAVSPEKSARPPQKSSKSPNTSATSPENSAKSPQQSTKTPQRSR